MVHIRLIAVLALCLGLVAGASAQEALWEDLDQQVNRLYQEGKYAEATEIAKRAVEVATKTFGPNDPKVATSLNDLALLYQSQGRYADAEPLYKRSLEIREKALGKEHPDVAISLDNIGVLYQDRGDYAEALRMVTSQ